MGGLCLAVLLLVTSLQPSAAARYASKALAAHVSMLQSEALVLEYQRQQFEAELARLKARPGFGQPQQEQHLPNQQRRPHKHQSIRANPQPAVCVVSCSLCCVLLVKALCKSLEVVYLENQIA